MIGHLGSRVSALLDGRLPAAEEERAWQHVHACHPCRDLVEREGWVKTRLAELGQGPALAPPSLKQSLLDPCPGGRPETFATYPSQPVPGDGQRVRPRHLAALGGGAVGVAVVGVLALGAAPANAPQNDRRGPVTSIVPPTPSADPSARPSGRPTVRPGWLREKMGP